MPIQSIDTRRVYQQIADQLCQLIEAGEFAVDSRLPSERDLAEKFKVSRPSVREALIALEVAGLVQIRMGSGVYICKPEQGRQKGRLPEKNFAPFELIQARLLIEAEIAGQAALCRTDEQVQTLEQLLGQMIRQSENNQSPLDADREFHAVLAGQEYFHAEFPNETSKFSGLGKLTNIWTSTDNLTGQAFAWYIDPIRKENKEVIVGKNYWFPIRCIKDE